MTRYLACITETRCFEFESEFDLDSDALYEEAKAHIEDRDVEVTITHRDWDDIVRIPAKEDIIEWMVENGAEIIRNGDYEDNYTAEEIPLRIFSGQVEDLYNDITVTSDVIDEIEKMKDEIMAAMVRKAKEAEICTEE